jgi:hypothetical protein
LSISKAEKAGTREVAQLAVDETGKTILKTAPAWAKGVKTVANFIPLADIPIGASLDVYFSKYEQDPEKKIDWWSAIKANTAGELAQMGYTVGGAIVASEVPVAGTITGGIGGFIVGAGADIATTELAYKAMNKTSLFDTSAPAPVQTNQALQVLQTGSSGSQAALKNLTSNVSVASSAAKPITTAKPAASLAAKPVAATPAQTPAAKLASGMVAAVAPPITVSTTTAAKVSTTAKTTTAAKAAAPAPAPKVSVVSSFISAVKSVVKKATGKK